jgi:aspartyl-tRNA(Asn)/glutamyl-tRNA(Gln) amidotransferase subunit A
MSAIGEDLLYTPLADLAERIRAKALSPLELLERFLERIELLNPKLNCYITVLSASAREEARAAEKEISSGHYRGPLHGIPVAVKDIFATRGVRTTAGSKLLANWKPEYDATVIRRLRAAGAVLIGKTNLHEFSYGVTSDNPFYGAVRNPWDPRRVAGGSSGGSAAAVAAGLCVAAIGSDTGGSIRIPSAVCGASGLKPTYGRTSRFGAVPLAWSLDHVGPIARTARDAALVLQAIAGADANDSTTRPEPVPDFSSGLENSLSSLRLGIPKEYFFDHVDSEVLGAVRAAIATLERLGARSQPVSLPHLEVCPALSAQLTLAEATSYHEPLMEKHLDDYSPDVRVRLEAGRYLLASDYLKSQRARTLLQKGFARALEQTDVLVLPTLPAFSPPVGEVYVQSGDLREHVVDAFTRFCVPFNLTGLPSISIPCGFNSGGLPIGMQIAGRPLEEATVLRVAHAFQRETRWHLKRPGRI